MIYFYPNRPILLAPDHEKVGSLSKNPNWIAEKKWNGDRLVLLYDGKFLFCNRNKSEFKRYTPTREVLEELKSLDLPKNTQLDGELVHNKTKDIKHQLKIYDIYTYDNEKVRLPLLRRKRLLKRIFSNKQFIHLERVKHYKSNFYKVFLKLTKHDSAIEGLVMKDLTGMITWNPMKSVDVAWQIKIRKESKNYKF